MCSVDMRKSDVCWLSMWRSHVARVANERATCGSARAVLVWRSALDEDSPTTEGRCAGPCSACQPSAGRSASHTRHPAQQT